MPASHEPPRALGRTVKRAGRAGGLRPAVEAEEEGQAGRKCWQGQGCSPEAALRAPGSGKAGIRQGVGKQPLPPLLFASGTRS